VKILRHVSTAKHANSRRQWRIERFDPTVSWQEFQDIDVRALREGMNTCVRSSRAVNADSSASDVLKGALEMILHRVAMRLALPTGERCTVVRNDEL
jgi:hypothetical protein